MESFLGLLSCLAFPIGTVITVLLIVLFFWLNNQSRAFLRGQRENRRNEIGANAIMAPAVVLSAQNGVVQRSRMWITFTVEVQPEGRPAFQTTFKDWVLLRKKNFVSWGERTEDIGQKIWVSYNLDDPTKMVFEHYDVDHRIVMGKKAFEKIYERNKIIRQTGEEAVALILEAQDLDLNPRLEKELNLIDGYYMLYKIEVHPNTGDPYKAELQAKIQPSSLSKLEVGKKCYVKFNPQDRSQVCISRAME